MTIQESNESKSAAPQLPNKAYFMQKNTMGDPVVEVIVDGKPSPLHHVVCHSPCGFEWGYGGSGPSDLALSILADYFGEKPTEDAIHGGRFKAWALHQDFKDAFIATAPRDRTSFLIVAREIDMWLRDNDPDYGKTWREIEREKWAEFDDPIPVETELPPLSSASVVYAYVEDRAVHQLTQETALVTSEGPDWRHLFTVQMEDPPEGAEKARVTIYKGYQEAPKFDAGKIELIVCIKPSRVAAWAMLDRPQNMLASLLKICYNATRELKAEDL